MLQKLYNLLPTEGFRQVVLKFVRLSELPLVLFIKIKPVDPPLEILI